MRVDLPAPFSPRRARISPGASEKSTPDSAVIEPKYLEMPTRESRLPFTVHRSRFTVCLQAGGMIVEFPGDPESLAEMCRQRLDPDGFGGVMPGIDDVHPEFHGVEIGMVGTLAGQVGIESGIPCRANPPTGPTADDPDAPRMGRASRNQPRSGAQEGLHPGHQRFAGQRRLEGPLHADRYPPVQIERLRPSQS